MSLMKAPKLERKHLLALKTLIRLDFTRAVRFKFESLQKNPEDPVESTIKMLTLTDILGEAEQPLSITMAMMEMHGSPVCWMPLNEEKFSFYSRVIAYPVGPEDFRSVAAEKVNEILEPLKVLQAELAEIFKNADAVDPRELFRQNGQGLSGTPPAKGMLN